MHMQTAAAQQKKIVYKKLRAKGNFHTKFFFIYANIYNCVLKMKFKLAAAARGANDLQKTCTDKSGACVSIKLHIYILIVVV